MFRVCLSSTCGSLLLVCCVFVIGAAAAETVYVKADATGANDGSSWEDAYVHLQDALADAGAGDEIWVATGVYKPDQGAGQTPGDRSASFELIGNVALYGGFAGDEATLEDRAGLFDETVLSGDLLGDDEPEFVNNDENSYHVLFADVNPDRPAVVDGFRVVGGNADGADSYEDRCGGGACLLRGVVQLRNCSFIANNATLEGGAVRLVYTGEESTGVFQDCLFEGNRASEQGGAVLVSWDTQATLERVVFRGNSAQRGAGLAAVGIGDAGPALSFVDCRFEANAASGDTPFWGGGGIYSEHSVVATTCAFHGNEAAQGAGLYCNGFHTNLECVLERCTFTENFAHGTEYSAYGGGFSAYCGSCVVQGCHFARNVVQPAAGGDAYAAGGGLNVKYLQSGLIFECTFEENVSSHDGGGAFTNSCSPWYVNCTFVGNVAHGNQNNFGGGGLFNNQDVRSRIINCVFIGNSATGTAEWAGGGAIQNALMSRPFIVNCAFAANSAASRGGGILSTWDSVARVRNCVLWGNTAGAASGEFAQVDAREGSTSELEYCCVEGWTGILGGVGNFGEDPWFADPVGPDGNPGTGDEDLHLAPGSPCIDRGMNWRVLKDRHDLDEDGDTDEYLPIDLDGEGRFFDDPNTPDGACGEAAIVDLGPYEVGGTGPQPCFGELTGDGIIGLADLACLLSAFGSEHTEAGFNSTCDLDRDGAVGVGDLEELLALYGNVCP
jgi:predicted outer membrane repeat protein